MTLFGLFQTGGAVLVALTALLVWSELRLPPPRGRQTARDDTSDYMKAMMPSSAKKD